MNPPEGQFNPAVEPVAPQSPPIAHPYQAPSAPPMAPSPQGGDGTGGVIPYKNPKALLAYYIGLFAILPVLGLGMGPAALILGIQGLKYAQQYPVVKGQVHAWIGIVLGGLWTLVHFGLLIVTIAGFALAR